MISATIRGKKVVDYRDGGTRWTDNPALCIADYLTNADFGMGFPAASELDLGNFNAEANHCDEIVQTSPIGGGFRCPRIISSAEPTKTYQYPAIGDHREHDGTAAPRRLPSAITVDSDTLGFDTGDRVMLSGNALPAAPGTNTSYYVIRSEDGDDYILQQLNVHRSPVIQLAATPRRAADHDPGNGSGTIWMLDRFWLLSTDTAASGNRRFRSGLSG